eukprot:scaffold8882_cov18-Tisochrysis_lutea.AAC.1
MARVTMTDSEIDAVAKSSGGQDASSTDWPMPPAPTRLSDPWAALLMQVKLLPRSILEYNESRMLGLASPFEMWQRDENGKGSNYGPRAHVTINVCDNIDDYCNHHGKTHQKMVHVVLTWLCFLNGYCSCMLQGKLARFLFSTALLKYTANAAASSDLSSTDQNHGIHIVLVGAAAILAERGMGQCIRCRHRACIHHGANAMVPAGSAVPGGS